MATFVSLIRHPAGDVIYVNMDKIISITSAADHTVLIPNTKDRPEIAVKQPPQEIIRRMQDVDQSKR
jgi:hypothetical protein